MRRSELGWLIALGAASLLYLLTRTERGQAMTGTLFQKIADLIAGHEGEVLHAYQDVGGRWTIGKGHLILPTDRVRGEALHPYGPIRSITREESDALFVKDTEAARNAVANSVRVPLTDNMRAALVSLAFNIGAGAFAASTLVRKLNAGDKAGAADQFLLWKKVNGQDNAGLLARRQNERAIFLS